MKTLLSAEKQQYKANLHSHSTLSDGKLTPQQLKDAYRAHGYSVLAITDHERTCDHSDLNEADFLFLTGYEMYIRPGGNKGSFDRYNPEVHINLFAEDPHNTGYIAYVPSIAHYTPEAEREGAVRLGKLTQRAYTVGFVNAVVEEAKKNGYIAAYNHPYWSLEEYDTILGYRGFFSMEMCNYSSYIGNRLEYNGQIYDALLRRGIRIATHSSDDNHNRAPFGSPRCDSFGGFTYILADRLTYGAIFDALRAGDFYSSMGPSIREVTVTDGGVRIRTSPVRQIILHNGSKTPAFAMAEEGEEPLTEVTLPLDERAAYFRITAIDGDGRPADTRGYFRDEWETE